MLESMTSFIQCWNKDSFGNIVKRKQEIMASFNGIQNSSHYGYNRYLKTLEYDLQDHLTQRFY